MTAVFLANNVVGHCPGELDTGLCRYLLSLSEVLLVLLILDAFIFLVTLIPPLFNWKNKKPDSRKRIFFAAFACLTFYFWLTVLAVQSLYCFGFWAHEGPCLNVTSSVSENVTNIETPQQTEINNNNTDSSADTATCINQNRNALKNVTLVNFLIIIVLVIVIAANINEGEICCFGRF